MIVSHDTAAGLIRAKGYAIGVGEHGELSCKVQAAVESAEDIGVHMIRLEEHERAQLVPDMAAAFWIRTDRQKFLIGWEPNTPEQVVLDTIITAVAEVDA